MTRGALGFGRRRDTAYLQIGLRRHAFVLLGGSARTPGFLEASARIEECGTLARKPFDVLAEGLIVSSSRGDKTAIELFLAGVQSLELGIRRRLDGG